ncbi:MAG: hypothetical protein ACOC31_00285 [Bacteroidota bacterium]
MNLIIINPLYLARDYHCIHQVNETLFNLNLFIMDYLGIFYFIFLALAITALFSYGFRSRGPWGSFWTFFLILFLAIWAADVWIAPTGPYWGDIYWFPPLAVGLHIALLLAAATPSPRARAEADVSASEDETDAVVAIGGFFWIILILLFIAAIAGLFINA